MERLKGSVSIFALLAPSNQAAKLSFTQVAQKMLENEDWNQTARQNIEIDDEPLQMSTYPSVSESDGGTEPPKTFRSVLRGHYAFDFAKPPRHPAKGWLIGGGKFSTSDERPEILLTERRKHDGVSSRHARLAYNFASGALIITASDRNSVCIDGQRLMDNQLVIHKPRTTLEFGQLKYSLDILKYDSEDEFRYLLRAFKLKHAIADDEYPWNLLATPSDSDPLTKKYILKNPIGDGATSVVYGAHHRISGNAVAIKKIRRTASNARAIEQDIEIARYIGKHSRICNLVDVIDPAAQDPSRGYEMFGWDEIFLIYTPLATWTVQNLITDPLPLDDWIREEIFWQLMEGIEFLHSIEIMHRDIKPANMTVISIRPDRVQARLIDFGMAKKGLESCQYRVGTSNYLAPEMWAGLENRTRDAYDERVDMFAFGISMYQLFCRQRCTWARLDRDINGNLSSNLLGDMMDQLSDSSYRDELKSVATSLIEWDPRERPTAREAMRQGHRHNQSHMDPVQTEGANIGEGHRETEDGLGGIGRSVGRMKISETGYTSHNSSSRDMSRYQPGPSHRSSPARDPRSWNPAGRERAYKSSPLGT